MEFDEFLQTFLQKDSEKNASVNYNRITMQQPQMNGQQLQPTQAYSACSMCKQNSRVCDRKLPHCSNCKTAHMDCTYSYEDRMKIPTAIVREESPRYEPYPKRTITPTMQTRQSPVPASPQSFTNVMPSALESYFEHLFTNTPVIERSKAQAIINFGRSARSQTSVPVFPTTAPNSDDMGLIFAMQSWFYRRFHMRSLSDRCFETSKNLLANSYDRVLTNFSVAVAYIYLGMSLLDDNDIPRAAFYFENVAAFIQKCKLRQQKHDKTNTTIDEQLQILRERFLEMIYQTCTSYMTANVNLIQGLKRFIYTNFVIKQYKRLTIMKEKQTGQETDPQDFAGFSEFDEFIPYLKNIKEDLDSDKDENFKMDLSIIDRVADKFKDSLTAPSERIPELVFTMRRLSALFVAQGAKIQYLQKMGRGSDPITRQVADYITALCDSAAFNLSFPMFSYPIHLAMKVHRQCMDTATDPKDRAQLVELLRADIKALYALSQSSKLVLPLYGPLIYDVERVIKDEEEKQRRTAVFTSLKSFIEPGAVSTPDPQRIVEEVSLPVNESLDERSDLNDNNDLDEFLNEFLHEQHEGITQLQTPSNEVMYW